MANEIHTFDPTAEGTGTQLQITLGGTTYRLREQSYPAPPLEPLYAGSIDTEGDRIAGRKHGNRSISHHWLVQGTSDATLESAVNTITAKIAKLAKEGGTYQRTNAAGTVRTYDVLASDGFDRAYNLSYNANYLADVSYTLIAKPYSRGPEVDLGDNVETSLPVLVWTEVSVPGDVWALGRLVLDNDAAASQYSLVWGVESRYYNAANALLFDASGTADGGSYGGSTKRTTLSTTPTTAVSWSGLGHVGMYRVLARMRHNLTTDKNVYAALTWSAGASLSATNPPVLVGNKVPYNYRIVDLGTVTLPKPVRGNPNFSGTITVWAATAGDTVDLDYYFFVPVMEGSGRANGTADSSGTLLTPVIQASKGVEVRWDGAMELTNSGSDYWGPVVGYSGDYLLVPNSGSENRPARFIVKMSRGLIKVGTGTGLGSYSLAADTAVDDLSARLFVTPRFLT